jgi:hypothetical protein
VKTNNPACAVVVAGLLIAIAGFTGPASAVQITERTPPTTASESQTSALRKPLGGLIVVATQLSNGKSRLRLTSTATKVTIRYRNVKGKKRTLVVKLKNGRRSLTLPAGASSVRARAKASPGWAPSPWVEPTTQPPAMVPVPQGISYWVGPDFALVVERTDARVNTVESNGSSGFCATGLVTGNIWTAKRDFADSDRIVSERALVNLDGDTLTLTAPWVSSWSSATEMGADLLLTSLNQYAYPARDLLGRCGFDGRRWR